MTSHITSYDLMPLPPIDAHTELFEAGAVAIGVEYRLLTDAIKAAHEAELESAAGGDSSDIGHLDDRGVSLHVFVVDESAGERREALRFDCFNEDPHYHYVSWRDAKNEMIHIDGIADGDPLSWALERIRTRLPQMLRRAGESEAAERVDPASVEEALPRITEAAFRVRYDHDEAAIALGAERRA